MNASIKAGIKALENRAAWQAREDAYERAMCEAQATCDFDDKLHIAEWYEAREREFIAG